MRSIMLVAKGPSAAHAESWRKPGDDVAVVNDAARYVSGKVQYAFFTHPHIPMEAYIDRIATVVSPVVRLPAGHWARTTPHATYRDTGLGGKLQDIVRRIASGGICHHHTSSAALHWLCKHGKYNVVRVIGIDGGLQYAPGAFVGPNHQQLIARAGKDVLDRWRKFDRMLCRVLSQIYDTQFEWYS